jgi:sortase (surface protein transpeptidase)
MPSLELDMQIDREGIGPNGDMTLPVSPFRAGWYEYAAAPNSPAGATVLAAHVDAIGEGLGPFAQLRSLEPGVEASVIDASGTTHTYRVVSVERIDKGVVPWANYFSLSGAPRLLLITCGGEYDAAVGSYDDNYIVTAEKVS